jgi:hypothetical protein
MRPGYGVDMQRLVWRNQTNRLFPDQFGVREKVLQGGQKVSAQSFYVEELEVRFLKSWVSPALIY